ncbi:ankyrin repeats (3 copies) domain-containing protein [Ditylenchus destructor]|nr:ankyrin repeats (3 copies) domain-containing protein [Ditylenchus destructor]
MLPQSSKENKDVEDQPTTSKKPKKTAEKRKDEQREEKDKKRRSSLTDSPLTSSSSSSASTASSSADDGDSKGKISSPNYKQCSDEDSPHSSQENLESTVDVIADSENRGIGAAKTKKSKSKKKKGKKSEDPAVQDNDVSLPDDKADQTGILNTATAESKTTDTVILESKLTTPFNKRNSPPVTFHQNNVSGIKVAEDQRPAYSTANNLMGTNTVRSVNSRMSYPPKSSFVNSNAYMRSLPTYTFNGSDSVRPTILCVHPGVVLEPHQDTEMYLQKYRQKWIRRLHQTITDGDYESFLRRIRIIMVTLCKKSPQYRQLPTDQLIGFIMQEIVSQFYNAIEQTTVLMSLVSTRDITKSCDSIDHGYCRIAEIILRYLPLREKRTMLPIATRRCGKTALHLAVANGSICQVDVLLRSLTSPNVLDKSGRAPLHYAIERNNLEMVKHLMWYGADIALCPNNSFRHTPLLLSMHSLNATLLAAWLSERVNALHEKFQSWIKSFCGELEHIKHSLSNVHFIRICSSDDLGYYQSQKTCMLDLRKDSSKGDIVRDDFGKALNQMNSRAILFMIPVFFHHTDQQTAADIPQLFRTCFPSGMFLDGKPTLSGRNFNDASLESVFDPVHNTHMYAFELPSKIEEGLYKLDFSLRSGVPFGRHSAYPILAIRVLICRQIDQNKSKKE